MMLHSLTGRDLAKAIAVGVATALILSLSLIHISEPTRPY